MPKTTLLKNVRLRVSWLGRKLILQVEEEHTWHDSTLSANIQRKWRDAKTEDITKLYDIRFFGRKEKLT